MRSLHLAGAHAAVGGTVYLYELTYPAPGAALGACHGLDPPGWPACTPTRRLTRIFDEEPVVVPDPEETSRRLWAGHRIGALSLPS